MAPVTDQENRETQQRKENGQREIPFRAGLASTELPLPPRQRGSLVSEPVEEWEGRSLPPDARGRAYCRPEGTRVCPRTLQYRSRGGSLGLGFQTVYDPNSQSRYYHSGINRRLYLRWVAEERQRTDMDIGAMVNAESADQPALLQAYVDYPNVPLVLDSGAYQQAGKTVSDYVGVLTRIDEHLKMHGEGGVTERFEWVANLDVIEGIGTGDHFFALREQGIEPLWVAHATAGRKEARTGRALRPPPEQAFELRKGMTIGIGGLVPIIKAERRTAARVIERIGRWLERQGLRGHFFGVGACPLLKQFSGAEWFESADSAKWLQGQKGRKLYLSDGGSIRAQAQGLRLSRAECARQNLRQIGRWFHRDKNLQLSW